MAVVSAEQVRQHLSSPPWSSDQERAVAANSAQREAELAAWLRMPITPMRRAETVPVLDSGLIATSAPIYRLYAINGVDVVGGAPPEGYTWRDTNAGTGHYLAQPALTDDPATPNGYSTRPFSPLYGVRPHVTVDYDAGWGPDPALTGAIMERVSAYAVNFHDDTVTARALDAEAPAPQREHWIDDDFVALRAYRRAGI